ncbi:MAG: nucleotide exchange factor GrpE [Nevskiaceae bacterium]|nr:MAG: nucleotide exchange factor GrpE [Nevskiaceae bacterium]
MSETESTPNPHSETPATPEAEIAALKAQLAEAEGRVAAARDAQLRAAAEAENTRRRIERDADASRKYAAEKLLGELLAVVDSLELGLKAAEAPEAQVKALAEGMQLTYRQLMALLEKQGVRQVDPKGEPFNPDLHAAMTMAETTVVAANHVVDVMQKGYRLHERLLRPAMVVVAKAPAAPAS